MTRRSGAGRRVKAGVVGLVALSALTLGACSQANTPEEYNTLTQQNFLESCTNYYFDNTDDTLARTDNTVKADVTAPDQGQCQCAYDVFVQKMPINETAAKDAQWAGYTGPNFTGLNSQLKTDPTKGWDSVPDDIKSDVAACIQGNGNSSSSTSTTTGGGDSTTTTAADAATTTSRA
jgi:hypothetical protein